jgi:hypothetical protein
MEICPYCQGKLEDSGIRRKCKGCKVEFGKKKSGKVVFVRSEAEEIAGKRFFENWRNILA